MSEVNNLRNRLETLVPGLTIMRHIRDQWLDVSMSESRAAALTDRLEQAGRDKAAIQRVRALCDDYDYLISTDDIRHALNGTEADR